VKRLAVALVAYGAVGGCAHTARPVGAPALDALLGFADPALCRQSDANEGFRAGHVLAPPGLRTAFGDVRVVKHDGWWEIGVPVAGTLFGLPVTRIFQALPEGGDPGGVTYAFVRPVAEVGRVLRDQGFPARAGEDVQLGPPDGYAHTLFLRRGTATTSLLSCGYS